MGELVEYIGDALSLVMEELANTKSATSTVIAAILYDISSGSTVRGACLRNGVDEPKFASWKTKSQTLYRLVLAAKEESKDSALRAYHEAATRKRTSKKVTITEKEVLKDDGNVAVLRTVSSTEEEIPPDWRASKSILEMQHPEEFGRTDRQTALRINSETGMGQVEDLEDIDNADPEALSAAIDMMIERGKFVVKSTGISIEDEYESIEPVKKDEITEEDILNEFAV